jgi:hypothetical protein
MKLVPTQSINELEKGNKVEHAKCNRAAWKHLNNGAVDDISLSGKSVYVRWFDEKG